MKIQEVLDKTATFFRSKQMDSPRLDAELLIAGSLGIERIQLYLKFDQPLKEDEIERCREYVRRRTAGEPVAYILNSKHFYGNEFFVDSRVLIPRPETELLVEMAIEELKSLASKSSHENLYVLDMGAGSGCIGLSILKREAAVQATLVDAYSGPLEVIKLNADRLEVIDRATLIQSKAQDLLKEQAELKSKFQIVLANPPYIGRDDVNVEPEVKKYEPETALFAGDQGLAEIKSWLPTAVDCTHDGGLLIFEMGWKQGPEVAEIFKAAGLSDVKIHKDLAQLDRFVSGRKKGL